MSFRPYEKPVPSDLPTQVPLPVPSYIESLQSLSLTQNSDLLQEIIKEDKLETQDTVSASPTWTIQDLDVTPSTGFFSNKDGQSELQPLDYMECDPIPESPRKIPRVHHFRRVMDDGTVKEVQVVGEVAVRALVLNGFKESDAFDGEPADVDVPLDVVPPAHVIEVPSRLAGILEGWDLHTFASFLQPSSDMKLAAQIALQLRSRAETATVEEYQAALTANPSLNPLLRPRPESPTRKIRKHSKKSLKARGRFPEKTKESVLDKLFKKADKMNTVERIAAANFAPRMEDQPTYF